MGRGLSTGKGSGPEVFHTMENFFAIFPHNGKNVSTVWKNFEPRFVAEGAADAARRLTATWSRRSRGGGLSSRGTGASRLQAACNAGGWLVMGHQNLYLNFCGIRAW